MLCPADELFYKGQLLPLHLSPRISMVRTLLLASSSTSSSSTTSTNVASRDSTGSSSSTSSITSELALLGPGKYYNATDSSRPSFANDQDDLDFKKFPNVDQRSRNKYFSLSKFSYMFNKNKEREPNKARERYSHNTYPPPSSSSMKRMSFTAKEVIRKYLKKVKPLYDKVLSQKQQKNSATSTTTYVASTAQNTSFSLEKTTSNFASYEKIVNGSTHQNVTHNNDKKMNGGFPLSFSGNLQYPSRRSCVSSCPSSMRSSPSHSGVLGRNGFPVSGSGSSWKSNGSGMYYSDTSSMEELQNAIQGAITHCKNSLMQNKTNSTSNEI